MENEIQDEIGPFHNGRGPQSYSSHCHLHRHDFESLSHSNHSEKSVAFADVCNEFQTNGNQVTDCICNFNKNLDSSKLGSGQTSPSITPSSSVQSLSSINTADSWCTQSSGLAPNSPGYISQAQINGSSQAAAQGDVLVCNDRFSRKGVIGVDPHVENSGVSTEGYDGLDEGSVGNSMYAALCRAPSSFQEGDLPLDIENNSLLWIPPPPEDDEGHFEISGADDEDNENNDNNSQDVWSSSESLSISNNRGCKSKEKSTAGEQRRAMKAVVDGHFQVLVSQLLNAEGIQAHEDSPENWLNIVTSLSLQAATVVKPDTIGGMDPGGYVKVKCVAAGRRSESRVIKGIVCKRNVAHRRMMTQFKNARLLLLGFSLEFQMALSSMETLLQLERDHLSIAVSRIAECRPNVLLVEKSVSRAAQERILAKGISLILNVKRPLLERIARCTNATIIANIEQLSLLTSAHVGYCEDFHVEKYIEDHGKADQGGRQPTKTLMFFEDCPRPLGCSILLMGSTSDELKRVKRAVQFAVFAAYHLALETSFLADEGVNLPELRLKSPLTVALPDKKSKSDLSISTISEISGTRPSQVGHQARVLSTSSESTFSTIPSKLTYSLPESSTHISAYSSFSSTSSSAVSIPLKGHEKSIGFDTLEHNPSTDSEFEDMTEKTLIMSFQHDATVIGPTMRQDDIGVASSSKEVVNRITACGKTMINAESSLLKVVQKDVVEASSTMAENQFCSRLNLQHIFQSSTQENHDLRHEEFPPSPSNHQSILVSFSSSCFRKGTICERGHLYRIKYYGTFDKPLGKFLRDTIFDTVNKCHACGELKYAHVDCYTHQQGSLTISVHKQNPTLPGQHEGKIWMWHRCLKCTRINGIPPATHRVVMSDAAWGLSFGKFLELSFSNHAAASRVASCGHSLHRDCLRFYGFGNMVACLRYSPVNIYSVYLPPSKVEFCYTEHQNWLQQEIKEISEKGNMFFKDAFDRLHQIQEVSTSNCGKIVVGKKHVAELEDILSWQQENFQTALYSTMIGDGREEPHIDILHLNYVRRSLVNFSSVWDGFLQALPSSFKTKYYGLDFSSGDILSSLKGISFGIRGTHIDSQNVNGGSISLKEISGSIIGIKSEDEKNAAIEGCALPMETSITDTGFETRSYAFTQKSAWKLIAKPGGKASSISALQFTSFRDVSATFDAAWTGKVHQDSKILSSSEPASRVGSSNENIATIVSNALEENRTVKYAEMRNSNAADTPTSPLKAGELSNAESWVGVPYTSNKVLNSPIKPNVEPPCTIVSPVARAKVSHCLVSVYDDEPTSIIAYAISSLEHQSHLSDRTETPKGKEHERLVPDNDCSSHATNGSNEQGSVKDMRPSNIGELMPEDRMLHSKTMHVKVNFSDNTPQGYTKYTVTCYYAKQFDGLRRSCCPEEDFICSLCRCKKWGAQGGKSNVFFAKTADDRFVVKQVTKTELESFITFAPSYFKYMSDALVTGSPTCLAKILGIYQVVVKHAKGGKELRMDLMIMENLLYRRQVTQVYDLKGSLRSRYNADASGKNTVLLDQNLLESIQTNPIFISSKSKRLLERAVWNDTAFLASVDVMDYSLLVGIDEEKRDLVLGIIDFMRQYTWDKHLETWVKASGILGGPKNGQPTVISPKQYKKRFRKAMSNYFLMVPDQWSPPNVVSGLPRYESVDRGLLNIAVNNASSLSEKARNPSI